MLRSERMLNIEKYKEELENIGVINPNGLVKVDTPILVKDILKSEWIKRYFAKYENGRVYVWKEGKTSWSAVNELDVNSWKYAKLAESEEWENE